MSLKITVPAYIFDYFHLISLAYPDGELSVEVYSSLSMNEYMEFVKGTKGSVYGFCFNHKLWTSNILEKNWNLT